MFTRIFSPAFICFAAGFGYILCLAGDGFWLSELAVHWRLHMAVLSALFSCAFVVAGRWLPSLWMFVLAVSFAFPAIKIYAPLPPPSGHAVAKVTILQFNVLYTNGKFSASIPWIKAQNADIIILQEINEERAKELGELKKIYPWSQVKLNKNREAFGMAIFSRLPVQKFNYVGIGDGWNHYSLTEFLIKNKKLHLYELHTPPPMSEFFFEQRNLSLELLANVMAKDKTAYRLLVGDLNNTVYSRYFQNILSLADLHHAQQNYNIYGTWPDILPAPLRIGIDHLLASKNIKIEKRVIGEKQMSDHLPVVTTISLYEDI